MAMEEVELQRYWSDELKWGRGYQSDRIFRFMREAGEFSRGGAVLDAGAGHQRYKPFFAASLYLTQEHPAGIEMKRMQNIFYDLVSPIDERIPLKEGSLRAVISTSVIEHLRYPERFISEAFRALSPGGKIFINVPFAYPEHEVPFDFQRPTRYGLVRWLEDANFTNIQVEPSSSSTETSLAFLKSSIEQDLFRGTPVTSRSALFRSIRSWVSARPFDFFKRVLIWLTLVPLVKALSALAKILVDRGPDPSTTYPVGWLAVATKPGQAPAVGDSPDREAFLREFTEA